MCLVIDSDKNAEQLAIDHESNDTVTFCKMYDMVITQDTIELRSKLYFGSKGSKIKLTKQTEETGIEVLSNRKTTKLSKKEIQQQTINKGIHCYTFTSPQWVNVQVKRKDIISYGLGGEAVVTKITITADEAKRLRKHYGVD